MTMRSYYLCGIVLGILMCCNIGYAQNRPLEYDKFPEAGANSSQSPLVILLKGSDIADDWAQFVLALLDESPELLDLRTTVVLAGETPCETYRRVLNLPACSKTVFELIQRLNSDSSPGNAVTLVPRLSLKPHNWTQTFDLDFPSQASEYEQFKGRSDIVETHKRFGVIQVEVLGRRLVLPEKISRVVLTHTRRYLKSKLSFSAIIDSLKKIEEKEFPGLPAEMKDLADLLMPESHHTITFRFTGKDVVDDWETLVGALLDKHLIPRTLIQVAPKENFSSIYRKKFLSEPLQWKGTEDDLSHQLNPGVNSQQLHPGDLLVIPDVPRLREFEWRRAFNLIYPVDRLEYEDLTSQKAPLIIKNKGVQEEDFRSVFLRGWTLKLAPQFILSSERLKNLEKLLPKKTIELLRSLENKKGRDKAEFLDMLPEGIEEDALSTILQEVDTREHVIDCWRMLEFEEDEIGMHLPFTSQDLRVLYTPDKTTDVVSADTYSENCRKEEQEYLVKYRFTSESIQNFLEHFRTEQVLAGNIERVSERLKALTENSYVGPEKLFDAVQRAIRMESEDIYNFFLRPAVRTKLKAYAESTPRKQGSYYEMLFNGDERDDNSRKCDCPDDDRCPRIILLDTPVFPHPDILPVVKVNFPHGAESPDEPSVIERQDLQEPAFDCSSDIVAEASVREHGTQMAGIMVSRQDARIVGLAPKAQLFSHAFDQYYSGREKSGREFGRDRSMHNFIVKALDKSRDDAVPTLFVFASEFRYDPKGADKEAFHKEEVDVLSPHQWNKVLLPMKDDDKRRSFPGFIQSLLDAHDALWVVAAGQKTKDRSPRFIHRSTPLSPMNLGDQRNVVVVTACDPCSGDSARLWREANYSQEGLVNLAAPGTPNILTTAGESGYAVMGGTSQAAAYVGGLVAQMMTCSFQYFLRDAARIKRWLQITSTPFPESAMHDNKKVSTLITGGIVNPKKALLDPTQSWYTQEEGGEPAHVAVKFLMKSDTRLELSNGDYVYPRDIVRILKTHDSEKRIIFSVPVPPEQMDRMFKTQQGRIIRSEPVTMKGLEADKGLVEITCLENCQSMSDETLEFSDIYDLIVTDASFLP